MKLEVYETSATNNLKAISYGLQNNMHSFPAEGVTTLANKESGGQGKKVY